MSEDDGAPDGPREPRGSVFSRGFAGLDKLKNRLKSGHKESDDFTQSTGSSSSSSTTSLPFVPSLLPQRPPMSPEVPPPSSSTGSVTSPASIPIRPPPPPGPPSAVKLDKPDRGNPQRAGQEDLQIMMEQISSLSTMLADARMAKQEFETENKSIRQVRDRLLTEVDVLRNKAEEWEQKYKEVKEKIVYEKVQEGQMELKKIKEEKVSLTKQLQELKQQNEELRSLLKEKTEDERALQEELNKEKKAHEETKAELRSEKNTAGDLLDQVHSQEEAKEKSDALIKELKAELDNKVSQLTQEHTAEVQKLNLEFSQKLKHMQEEVEVKTAERNAFKQKADGVSKELKKLVQTKGNRKETDAENARLREELARKSKSLSDAMSALSLYMQEAGTGAELPNLELLKDENASKTKDAWIKENNDLQQLANKLSTAINEKDIAVAHYRGINSVLGKRLIELEKKLGMKPGEGMENINPLDIDSSQTPRRSSISVSSVSVNSLPPDTSPLGPTNSSPMSDDSYSTGSGPRTIGAPSSGSNSNHVKKPTSLQTQDKDSKKLSPTGNQSKNPFGITTNSTNSGNSNSNPFGSSTTTTPARPKTNPFGS